MTDQPALAALVRAGLLCNDASLHQSGGHWQVAGDPTEGALLTLALKCGLDAVAEQARRPRCDVIPFESERRYMATLHELPDGGRIIYLKGAPEQVLSMCDRQRGRQTDEPLDIPHWQAAMKQLAGAGQRVLALALREGASDQRELAPADSGQGFVLLGMVGQADPPRPEAIAAVAQCHAAGIRVKMITGDHAGTARAIASELGLNAAAGVLTGPELDSLDDDALRSLSRVRGRARSMCSPVPVRSTNCAWCGHCRPGATSSR